MQEKKPVRSWWLGIAGLSCIGALMGMAIWDWPFSKELAGLLGLFGGYMLCLFYSKNEDADAFEKWR